MFVLLIIWVSLLVSSLNLFVFVSILVLILSPIIISILSAVNPLFSILWTRFGLRRHEWGPTLQFFFLAWSTTVIWRRPEGHVSWGLIESAIILCLKGHVCKWLLILTIHQIFSVYSEDYPWVGSRLGERKLKFFLGVLSPPIYQQHLRKIKFLNFSGYFDLIRLKRK